MLKLKLPFLSPVALAPKVESSSTILADIKRNVARLETAARANDEVAAEAERTAAAAKGEADLCRRVAGRFRGLIS